MPRRQELTWAFPNRGCSPQAVVDARTRAKDLLGGARFDRLCELGRDARLAMQRAWRREDARELRDALPVLRTVKKQLATIDAKTIAAAARSAEFTITIRPNDQPSLERNLAPEAGRGGERAEVALREAAAQVDIALDALRAIRPTIRADGTSGRQTERGRTSRARSRQIAMNHLARAAARLGGMTPTALAYFCIGDYLEAPCTTRVDFQKRELAWKIRLRRARAFHGYKRRRKAR